jgi:hypothetical protein
MVTFAKLDQMPSSYLFRWTARASAVVMIGIWLGLILAEAMQGKIVEPGVAAFYQAAALAVVFAGYAIGWRHELAGGLLAVVGTVAFFAVHVLSLQFWPDLSAVWFAAPGVLYLLACYSDAERGERLGRPS